MCDWLVMPRIMSRVREIVTLLNFGLIVLRFLSCLSSFQVSLDLTMGKIKNHGKQKLSIFFILWSRKKKSSNDVTSTGQIKSESPKGCSFMASSKSFLPWNSLRSSKTQTSSAQSNRQLIWQCQESIGIMRCMSSIKLGTSWGQWKHVHYVENLLIMPFSF